MNTGLARAYDQLLARLEAQQAILERIANASEQQHAGVLREWEPLRGRGGTVASAAGVATVYLEQVPLGWEWELGRITVSASGVSAGGTVVAYVIQSGSQLSGSSQDELFMVDYKVLLDGNSPSRGIADEMTPVRMTGGDQLAVYFTAVAGSATVTVRFEGRRRTV